MAPIPEPSPRTVPAVPRALLAGDLLLCLVQEKVAGKTFADLRRDGRKWTEAEFTDVARQDGFGTGVAFTVRNTGKVALKRFEFEVAFAAGPLNPGQVGLHPRRQADGHARGQGPQDQTAQGRHGHGPAGLQVLPSPVQPVLHWQVYAPPVLPQTAAGSQIALPLAHSSTSSQSLPSPR